MSEPEEYQEPEEEIDFCYECRGLGDDYTFDEDGELVDYCDTCPMNPYNQKDYGI
jgi:hypothetical protein